MTIVDHLKKEADRCRVILHQLESSADPLLSGGLLTGTNRDGSKRLYHRTTDRSGAGPKRVYRRIDGDAALIRTLRANALLKHWKKRLERNIRVLTAAAEEYVPVDLTQFAGVLPRSRVSENARSQGEPRLAGLTWEELKSSCRPFRSEELHFEADGGHFRSKGEVLHAMCFAKREIEYLYEPELRIDGITIRPDFVVRNKRTGKIYIWEFFGMMDVEEYQRSFGRKMQAFLKLGIVPGCNLICTCEFRGICELSTEEIFAKIDAYLV